MRISSIVLVLWASSGCVPSQVGVPAAESNSEATAAPQLGDAPLQDVIAAMTREEKVSLVMGNGMFWPGQDDWIKPPPQSIGRNVPGAAGTTYAIPRLGIPTIVLADGPAGVRIDPVRDDAPGDTFHSTKFPIASLLASTWDPELVERVGAAMGDEAKAYGIDILLAPALNLHRNPLGGRNFEYYSEDPRLSGILAAAFVRGVQSTGVGATIKHYAANNHEWERLHIDVEVGPRPLRELYLKGFEIAVKTAEPWALMTAYNQVNGAPTSAHPELLADILFGDWGFQGLVITDWFVGFGSPQLQAGNHLLMPGAAGQRKDVLAALKSGQLDEASLDSDVAVVLRTITRSLTFQGHTATNRIDAARGKAVAREAATQGMVLLKNEGALPLASEASIALFGHGAYDTVAGGAGSGDVNAAYTVSLDEALSAAGFKLDQRLARAYREHIRTEREKAPEHVFLEALPVLPRMVATDTDIERAVRGNDMALIALSRRSTEAIDRTLEDDFELREVERALIRRVATVFRAAGKPVVLALNVGGPVEIVTWRDEVDAILLVWQPGQEAGDAIVAVVVPQNVVRREMCAAMVARETRRTELRSSRALPTARDARVASRNPP